MLADVAPAGPVEEGAELQVELVEVDRHDGAAAVAHVDGIDVCVGEAAELVGKKVKVKVERVFEGIVYASLVRRTAKKAAEPLTAEAEAEKPTRKPPARKAEPGTAEPTEAAVEPDDDEPTDEVEVEAAVEDGAAPAKKKTRRGTRGGRNRKKKPATATGEEPDADDGEETAPAPAPAKTVTIHLPPEDLGEDPDEEEAAPENGDTPGAAKKRTRRGSRGGKNRRKREARADDGDAPSANGDSPEPEPEPAAEAPAQEENWDYVPMSQWGDEFTE
jgi:predicted RNA-binding protein with TRAM domain